MQLNMLACFAAQVEFNLFSIKISRSSATMLLFHSNAPLSAWVPEVIPPQVKDFLTSLGLSGIALKGISTERLCFS